LTDDEYRDRAWNIEREAQEQIARVRRSFHLMYPARRATRYAGGMADAIREVATADSVAQIYAEMGKRLDALDIVFYEIDAAELESLQ
jgi:hypothetical protein